jgi:hypothetical protein
VVAESWAEATVRKTAALPTLSKSSDRHCGSARESRRPALDDPDVAAGGVSAELSRRVGFRRTARSAAASGRRRSMRRPVPLLIGWVSEVPFSTRRYDWLSDAESECHGGWRSS